MTKQEIRKIVEKDLLKFFDAKTLLSNNQILMELCMDSTLKAINYTRCSTELNTSFKKGEKVNEFNKIKEQLLIHSVGSSLPDLQECNQAALDYADKKGNPDFFLIKQVFKEGVNWALNKVVKTK